jgi:phytanoyl-CoA hydroxylase
MSGPTVAEQVATLREQGFVVVRGFAAANELQALRELSQRQLEQAAAPVEYEADLQYPGAPASRQAEGGHTVRRLLDA